MWDCPRCTSVYALDFRVKMGVFKRFLLVFAILCCLWSISRCEEKKPSRYEIMTLNWDEVQVPLTVSIWIFIACLEKIGKIRKLSLLTLTWRIVSQAFFDSSHRDLQR